MQVQSFEEIVKMQPKGLLTIPKNIRIKYGFEENGLVKIRAVTGRIYLEPVRALPYPVRNYTAKELEEFFNFDKKLSK
ncbi:AbrB/MazE/SpoVT family DNA-binding domain-containing protein [Microgenomates group bacterium]|nr:AbrB/MazE/SpoVT family DNA-binding domain-containing protein [Patescibacteria group bacterium]MBU1499259.1 AbrB/MazE/SpoVT family DNA-binding domain-containing protein [Patescibacteria group bacterium]MCG2691845.1 AbrB/MazE/SpoVT family DNA-binding domain-containing protein [Microgenomates group bacterium]